MQKFFSMLSIFLFALGFASCASSSKKNVVTNPQNAIQLEQNKKAGLPLWLDCNFTSEESALFLGNYKNEKGFYASGKGDSSTSARINARNNLIDFCKSAYNEQTENAQTLYGSRIIDSFTAEDSTVYVLIFISEKDAKKSFSI